MWILFYQNKPVVHLAGNTACQIGRGRANDVILEKDASISRKHVSIQIGLGPLVTIASSTDTTQPGPRSPVSHVETADPLTAPTTFKAGIHDSPAAEAKALRSSCAVVAPQPFQRSFDGSRSEGEELLVASASSTCCDKVFSEAMPSLVAPVSITDWSSSGTSVAPVCVEWAQPSLSTPLHFHSQEAKKKGDDREASAEKKKTGAPNDSQGEGNPSVDPSPASRTPMVTLSAVSVLPGLPHYQPPPWMRDSIPTVAPHAGAEKQLKKAVPCELVPSNEAGGDGAHSCRSTAFAIHLGSHGTQLLLVWVEFVAAVEEVEAGKSAALARELQRCGVRPVTPGWCAQTSPSSAAAAGAAERYWRNCTAVDYAHFFITDYLSPSMLAVRLLCRGFSNAFPSAEGEKTDDDEGEAVMWTSGEKRPQQQQQDSFPVAVVSSAYWLNLLKRTDCSASSSSSNVVPSAHDYPPPAAHPFWEQLKGPSSLLEKGRRGLLSGWLLVAPQWEVWKELQGYLPAADAHVVYDRVLDDHREKLRTKAKNEKGSCAQYLLKAGAQANSFTSFHREAGFLSLFHERYRCVCAETCQPRGGRLSHVALVYNKELDVPAVDVQEKTVGESSVMREKEQDSSEANEVSFVRVEYDKVLDALLHAKPLDSLVEPVAVLTPCSSEPTEPEAVAPTPAPVGASGTASTAASSGRCSSVEERLFATPVAATSVEEAPEGGVWVSTREQRQRLSEIDGPRAKEDSPFAPNRPKEGRTTVQEGEGSKELLSHGDALWQAISVYPCFRSFRPPEGVDSTLPRSKPFKKQSLKAITVLPTLGSDEACKEAAGPSALPPLPATDLSDDLPSSVGRKRRRGGTPAAPVVDLCTWFSEAPHEEEPWGSLKEVDGNIFDAIVFGGEASKKNVRKSPTTSGSHKATKKAARPRGSTAQRKRQSISFTQDLLWSGGNVGGPMGGYDARRIEDQAFLDALDAEDVSEKPTQ